MEGTSTGRGGGVRGSNAPLAAALPIHHVLQQPQPQPQPQYWQPQPQPPYWQPQPQFWQPRPQPQYRQPQPQYRQPLPEYDCGLPQMPELSATCVWHEGNNSLIHTLRVDPGEDIRLKITSHFQEFGVANSRAVCTLNATGPVSTFRLRPPDSFIQQPRTLEGPLDLKYMNFTYCPPMIGGRFRYLLNTDRMRVVVAHGNGSLETGDVAGSFLAAAPVTITVGSYLPSPKLIEKLENIGHRLSSMPILGLVPYTGFNPSPRI